MKKIFSLMVLAFFLSCCSLAFSEPIKIYTFKKDRVDQEIRGNQGFISGKPSSTPGKKKRNLKRTLIGIDIDLSNYEEESGSSETEITKTGSHVNDSTDDSYESYDTRDNTYTTAAEDASDRVEETRIVTSARDISSEGEAQETLTVVEEDWIK